jgi:allantoate deiminase
VAVAEAIRDFGLEPDGIPALRAGANAVGYLEVHIEQGPTLEQLAQPIGVVSAIAGQSRATLTFTGQSGHAGTTPMNMRRDALAAAAEWMLQVEQEAQSTPGLVATVGRVEASPGVGNVIAGRALASLDVRHEDDGTRRRSVNRLRMLAEDLSARRGVSLVWHTTLDQPAVAMSATLVGPLVRAAARCAGGPVHQMPSGAGHDAMVMASVMPAAMLFVRSPGGLSHHPDEAVLVEDVAAALLTVQTFLEELAEPSRA